MKEKNNIYFVSLFALVNTYIGESTNERGGSEGLGLGLKRKKPNQLQTYQQKCRPRLDRLRKEYYNEKTKIKLLSLILILTLVCSFSSAYALDSKSLVLNEETIVSIEENVTDDYKNASVIIVPFDKIETIRETARELLDDGAMLYITSPESSNEELASLLSIPKAGITKYNELVLLATSIYKYKNTYVFENHYATFETTDKKIAAEESSCEDEIRIEDERPFKDTVVTVNEKNASKDLDFVLNPKTQVHAAIESRNSTLDSMNSIISNTGKDNLIEQSNFELFKGELNEQKVSLLPSDLVSKIGARKDVNDGIALLSYEFPETSAVNTDTLSVYGVGGAYLGYIKATQNRYEKGYVTVNGVSQYCYNLVTCFEANPTTSHSVTQYKGRIHCNIVGHTSLEPASLTSGVSYTTTVSIGTNYSAATSWTYNPESQVINRQSPEINVYDWIASPVNSTNGKSYDLCPGLCVATTNSAGSRGGFSKMYCYGYIFGIPVVENSFEVGEWF